ncbi:uncharacterized protein BT62DRAFT_231505 [Guyanagaster necrorhizus]|uniref:DUF6534 domain-containing protein n=1 Tax=Guyanagaster necrorhizus TaxID=856835 RepID=A0A9P7VQL1_9AGAR|nr:uncharacterized protein BT62DRAFT_231505 [Guyanagaster necrorhizus MCA 3950]KAG7444863.1 hypothetical protein BT62DRAFT_231505 [Guyanagaster necrorhizus MCA 3950]
MDLILFTVNTNLITTFLSLGSLYLVLPDATIYGGISFIFSKSYLISFLVILNSREFLRFERRWITTHSQGYPPFQIFLVQVLLMPHRPPGSSLSCR